ncbi:MAG: hypothetical protein INH41_15570 [Myxococcaceae bacterium]|nr:hypothetical protein [Myxococcaceae bacterium]
MAAPPATPRAATPASLVTAPAGTPAAGRAGLAGEPAPEASRLPGAPPADDEGPRLELPPDPDEPLPRLEPTARRPARPPAERPTEPEVRAVTRASDGAPRPVSSPPARVLAADEAPSFWLARVDVQTRWLSVVTAPLAGLLLVDLATAARPGQAPLAVALQAALAVAATVALVARWRLSWPAMALLVASVAWSGARPALDAWWLATTATLSVSAAALLLPRAGPLRFLAGLVCGLAALGLAAPELLDAVGEERWLGPQRDGHREPPSDRLTWPFVDQRTGVQFGPAALAPSTTVTPGLFVDRRTGAAVFVAALPRGLSFEKALAEVPAALSAAGLARVTVGAPRPDGTPAFDVSSTSPFSARLGRAGVEGVLRVAETGPEAFLLAAWARPSRRLQATLSALVETMRRNLPSRPVFESPRARALAERSALPIVGSTTWAARLAVGARGVVMVPASVAQGQSALTISVGGVTTSLPLAEQVTAAGVTLIPSTLTAESAPPRAFSGAPRLSRVLVRSAAFGGGWLTSEAGKALRPLDLQAPATGPAFDVTGALVGVALESDEGPALVTLEALAPALAVVLGAPVPLGEAPSAEPPPLYTAREGADELDPATEQRVRDGVVLLPTTAGPVAAVVLSRCSRGWVLAAPRQALAAEARTVRVRLGAAVEAEARGADVVRTAGDVALLVMEVEPSDALVALPVADSRSVDGRRVAFGFRDDPATGQPALRSARGELVGGVFEADPGPLVSAGPVVTADGRLTGLRLSDGVTVTPAAALVELGVAGLRDVIWRMSYEATGTCQLSVTAELEDPLGEATLVAVRVEPGEAPPRGEGGPTRLKAARLTDIIPRGGEAKLTYTLPCFTAAMQLQFEVASQGQTRVTWPQTLRPPPDLPWVHRGRSSGTPGAGPPHATLAVELWEPLEPVTMKHPCRTAPGLCERACAVDDFDACTLDGRHALASKEFARATTVLDGACGRGEVEACVLLQWALVEAKGQRAKASAERVLRPWCTAGVPRACAALDVDAWRKGLAQAQEACATAPSQCRRLAEQLLSGPRLDADVSRALSTLKQACGARDTSACGLFGRTVVQLDAAEPSTAMPFLERACAAGDLPSCTLRGMNPGRGLTMPRSPQIANAWYEEACARGAADACALVLR